MQPGAILNPSTNPSTPNLTLLDAQQATWAAAIERLYTALGGANNPALLPYHFLQVTLPRIGGHVALLTAGRELVAAGLLFPRARNAYTLRYHPVTTHAPLLQHVVERLAEHFPNAGITPYDPLGKLTYAPSHYRIGALDIGRPSAEEALAVRSLQQQVWGSPPEFLYPVDIHSREFELGCSLVARLEGQLVGFLFGFTKFGGEALPVEWTTRFNGELRIESQALGVAAAQRGARIGSLLKQQQAEQAQQEGIHVINWTVDPLQWPNAVLNFGRLRALAFHFTPDYYPFRNELNRVAASRFSVTWLVSSARVQQALQPSSAVRDQATPTVLDLKRLNDVARVNDGWQRRFPVDHADRIAIQIPADWTALQRDDLAAAVQWRTATDAIFAELIGPGPGQYVVTAVATDGDRCYLLADRASPALWTRLGAG